MILTFNPRDIQSKGPTPALEKVCHCGETENSNASFEGGGGEERRCDRNCGSAKAPTGCRNDVPKEQGTFRGR
jgi:hypothetical protein